MPEIKAVPDVFSALPVELPSHEGRVGVEPTTSRSDFEVSVTYAPGTKLFGWWPKLTPVGKLVRDGL